MHIKWAMSTFSPIGLQFSNGMRMCVSQCVCVYRMNLTYIYTTQAYPRISSFRAMPVLYTSTRILKPSEDSELMGLKVDIAHKMINSQFKPSTNFKCY